MPWLRVATLLLVLGRVQPVPLSANLGVGSKPVANSYCELDSFVPNKLDKSVELDSAMLQAHIGSVLADGVSTNMLTQINENIKFGLACMDGRSDETHLSAPGGDVGEFVLGLKVLEDMSQTQLSQFQVDDILVNLLASDLRETFHMCTDAAALQRLCRNTNFCFQRDKIERPNPEFEDSLLENLVTPEYVGNEHLRQLLTRPALYGVRRELTEMAIKSFFRVLWNHLGLPLTRASHEVVAPKLDLTVYEGNSREEGILSVVSSPDCPSHTLLLKPLANGHSLRVYYPNAADAVRDSNSELLAAEAKRMGLANINEPAPIATRIKALAKSLFQTTLNQFASKSEDASLKGYPHYQVVIPTGCCPTQFRRRLDKAPLEFRDSPLRQVRAPVRVSCRAGSVSVRIAPECSSEDKIRLDGYSIRQVDAHFQLNLGTPLEFVDAKTWGVAAVDGRSMESVLGVPGASVGQFAVVAALAELAIRGTQPVDVLDLLARYILSMKAPTFSYEMDVQTLFQICSTIKDCSSGHTSVEDRMRQLVAMFQNPGHGDHEKLLAELTKATTMGDPFLRFAVTDQALRGDTSRSGNLNPMETELLSALQKAVTNLKELDQLTLMRQWQFTPLEFKVLSDLIGSSSLSLDSRASERIQTALSQCLHDNPTLKDSIDADSALQSCASVLRRLAIYVSTEDGTHVVENNDLDISRRRVRAMIPRVVEAFFKLLWGQAPAAYEHYAKGIAAKLDLVVVDGTHQEHAFVTVRLAKSCPANMAPLLTPKRAPTDSSIWVYHPDAARQYRADIIDFVVAWDNNLRKGRSEISRVASDLEEELVRRFLFENMAEHPIYEMVVGEGCCPARQR